MPDLKQATLDYVRYVLESEKETASSLAKRIGVSSTTLTRPLNNPDHQSQISTATLQKIMAETGYDFAPFISREMNTLERTLDFFQSDDYDTEEYKTGDLGTTDSTLVLGEVRAGHWLEHRFLRTENFNMLFIAHSDPELRKRSIAMRVADESCDLFASTEDCLFCVLRQSADDEPTPGSPVIVERHLKGTNLFEITARMPRLHDGSEMRYHIHSSNRLLDGYVIEGETETEIVRVVADVLYAVRHVSNHEIYELERGQFIRAENLKARDELIRKWMDEQLP